VAAVVEVVSSSASSEISGQVEACDLTLSSSNHDQQQVN